MFARAGNTTEQRVGSQESAVGGNCKRLIDPKFLLLLPTTDSKLPTAFMDPACQILQTSRRIAVLGMSPNPQRTSHQIAAYLRDSGYEIVPVNPGHDEIEGLTCYAQLSDIPEPVDIVDVFRAADHEREVATAIFLMPVKPRAVWFQLNAGGYGVAGELRTAGIEVFVNSCIRVVHSLCGESRGQTA